ncbi:uncharacterized protein F58A4.6-like [Drosophila innubila]|uniref:uncharacterized protein F58A4.6-like n=1 Tax=Drosophila innubila TaxID=198719 RepID=UPI00148D5A61|nr:uncharacterized protein F58A4.6-like [Drosophila innubila]
MTLIVCVIDYCKRRHYFNRPIQVESVGEGKQRVKDNIVHRLLLQLDAVSGNYLLREVLQQKVLHNWLQHEQGVQLLWLTLQPPTQHNIDYKWAQMLAKTIWEHIQLEQLMCWLSTLGGGYSALGDQFEGCAETAGKISLQQLSIGLRLGNPLLQARCKLFYSISLIQRGQLRQAKQLIRCQYQLASSKLDQRLLRMCQGIWERLRYEYRQRQRKAICGINI